MTKLDSILKGRDITLPTKVRLVKAMVFPVVMYRCERLQRKLSAKELMLLNCGVGEDSWESLGQQGDPTSPSSRKSVLNIHWKDWCWNWNSDTLASWYEELTQWKRPWCWARLKAGGEGGEMVGWYHHLYWHEFESLWWTGKPDMLQPMGSQRVGHGWATEKNWTETEVQVQASRTLTSLSRRVVQK